MALGNAHCTEFTYRVWPIRVGPERLSLKFVFYEILTYKKPAMPAVRGQM